MFKEVYIRSLEQARSEIGSGAIDCLPLTAVDRSLTQSCPDAVWEKLTGPQRGSRLVSAWSKAVSAERYGDIFAEADYLRAAVRDIELSDEAVAITQTLLQNSVHARNNRTIPALASAVQTALSDGQPLQLWVSQCLDKGAQMMAFHNEYRLGRINGNKPGLDCFAEGVKLTAWEQLKALRDSVSYPQQITMLLGDMDYFTVFQLQEWLSQDSLPAFKAEMQERRSEVQARADAYFGRGNVSVRLWSEFYGLKDFEAAQARAATPGNWQNYSVLMPSSERMYLDQWGLADWGEQEGIPEATLRAIVRSEITRTVAQYRLESNIAADCRAIQAWAERVPTPTWPISISNYDGTREVPSLLLV